MNTKRIDCELLAIYPFGSLSLTHSITHSLTRPLDHSPTVLLHLVKFYTWQRKTNSSYYSISKYNLSLPLLFLVLGLFTLPTLSLPLPPSPSTLQPPFSSSSISLFLLLRLSFPPPPFSPTSFPSSLPLILTGYECWRSP